MDNYDISDALGFYAKLAELHNENPFRVKAFSAAAFNIKKVKDPLSNMTDEALSALPSVGKSVVASIRVVLESGTFPELEELKQKTPAGVLEMLRIKGLGPKKVHQIWKGMGISGVEELFDACRENRLVEQPGFGLKTQAEVSRAIEFSWGAKGKFHYARVEAPAIEIIDLLKSSMTDFRFEFTGEFRRKCEIIETVEILTDAHVQDVIKRLAISGYEPDQDREMVSDVLGHKFGFIHANISDFERIWFETTGSPAHIQALGVEFSNSEAETYKTAGYDFIEPELREGRDELTWAKSGRLKGLISYSDLKGSLHNHSNYSDGLQSLEEMARFCKDMGLEYLGICDHSKSAGYANGLQVERVIQQHEEIEKLNAELTPFVIFKGIESDILGDGSLDYEPEILNRFDLVVASVHSNLKMDEAAANKRLGAAIENPYTHILGHPTGRLLLLREGYPIDHRYIIDACAANGVAIEINANPFRLDLDWRWIGYAQDKGVMISINPDAHEKHALNDMYFGTLAARKGGLSKEFTLNALNAEELKNWLHKKRSTSLSGKL